MAITTRNPQLREHLESTLRMIFTDAERERLQTIKPLLQYGRFTQDERDELLFWALSARIYGGYNEWLLDGLLSGLFYLKEITPDGGIHTFILYDLWDQRGSTTDDGDGIEAS